MKLTVDNFQEKWPLISGKMPESITKRYGMAVSWAEDYNNSETCKKAFDMWINAVNSVAKDIPDAASKPSRKKITRKGADYLKKNAKKANGKRPARKRTLTHKYTKNYGKIKKGVITRKSHRELAAQLESIDATAWSKFNIQSGGEIDPTSTLSKYDEGKHKQYNEYCLAEVKKICKKKSIGRAVYDILENNNSHRMNQFLIDNGFFKGKYAETTKQILRNLKKDSKPKPQTENKPKKASYKIAPNWWKVMDSFRKMAGKVKDTWRIQNFLEDLQNKFNAKLGKATPFIEIIREIQDKIFPYANVDRAEKKKQTLPAWTELCNQCKAAMKTISISKKGEAHKYTTETLSGVRRRGSRTRRRVRY